MKNNRKNFVEILLVEDNKHDAELTMLALEENKLANHVTWLRDGSEALDFLMGKGEHSDQDTPQNPKVILLDLKMPKIDGLEVLRRIRAEESTRHIPVVVLTSSREEKDLIQSYKLGVNRYIVKPVEFDKFMACIKEIGMYWAVINLTP